MRDECRATSRIHLRLHLCLLLGLGSEGTSPPHHWPAGLLVGREGERGGEGTVEWGSTTTKGRGGGTTRGKDGPP